MSDSRRFQTSVYAALALMVRPACKSAARFANMPAHLVPKEPEHDPVKTPHGVPSKTGLPHIPKTIFQAEFFAEVRANCVEWPKTCCGQARRLN